MSKERKHSLALLDTARSDMKTVYTKDNCPGCVALKASLAQAGEAFKEVKIGRDITREEFMTKFPTVRTVPYVVDDDK